jgi:hypothetical protein
MQKAKINFMSKSTRTSNTCPSLPKLWYAKPFFSSLSDVLHVCNCNSKAQQPCATIQKSWLWRVTSFHASAEKGTNYLSTAHVIICRTSVLNAPSWVYSCPDIFAFLHTTLIMEVLVRANHVIIRNLKVVLGPNQGEWWYHKHTTGVILFNFSKPQCLNLQHAGKNTEFFHHLTSSFHTRKKLKV